jgi:hypothetical protein
VIPKFDTPETATKVAELLAPHATGTRIKAIAAAVVLNDEELACLVLEAFMKRGKQ